MILFLYEKAKSAFSEKGTSGATHWEGCGKEGGPRHYECLLRDYEELERKLRSAQSAIGATSTRSDK